MVDAKYKTLTEVMSECFIYDNPVKPLKEVASLVGKPYGTLTRELNPDDDGAKLSVDTFMMMLQHSGDMRPLQWIAECFGYSIVKNEPVPDKETWQSENVQDMFELGKMSQMMDENNPPYEIFQQAEKVKKEIDETVNQYTKQYNERKEQNK